MRRVSRARSTRSPALAAGALTAALTVGFAVPVPASAAPPGSVPAAMPASAPAAARTAPALVRLAPPNPAGRDDCVLPGAVFAPVPWPQQLWDLEGAWALSRGGGVTVAVLSSGVDLSQEQMAGRIRRGRSFLPDASADTPGNVDCVGLGTGLASVVVAGRLPGMGFSGVAPDASILPLVVSESPRIASTESSNPGTPAGLAAAIVHAVDAGARVILVGGYLTVDVPAVRAAVRAATARGALVVAPAGDLGGEGNPTTYPAAYPGVLGVSAMAQDLSMVPGSETGTYVDVVAPGRNIAVAARGSGHAASSGTPVAAAFAAAAAALVLGHEPSLTPAEVIARLRATAGPVGNGNGTVVGAGLLDPARAVLETGARPRATPSTSGGPLLGAPDPAVEAARAAAAARRRTATAAVFAAMVLTVLVGLGTVVLVRGRRRRWRPGVQPPPPPPPDDDTVPTPLFARSDD